MYFSASVQFMGPAWTAEHPKRIKKTRNLKL